MYKKRNFLLFIFVLTIASSAWATPPSKISLTYDRKEQKLHIDVKHPTNKTHKHYIRKLIIQKNDENPITIDYVAQAGADGFTEDVDLKAKSKDKISVEAICSKAGRKTEILVVP